MLRTLNAVILWFIETLGERQLLRLMLGPLVLLNHVERARWGGKALVPPVAVAHKFLQR